MTKAYLLEEPLESPLWGQVRTGLYKAMSVETCTVTMTELEEKVSAGELGVLITADEDEMVTGVALLDEDQDWVDVPFIWSAGLPSLDALFVGAEEIAKTCGVRGVKWCSGSEKVSGWAKRHGYRQRLVEYVKEV